MGKRVVWLLFFLFVMVIAEAQIIKGFVAGGLNMSQVDGDEAYGYKMPGLNVGVGAMVPFRTNWDLSLETSFTQKGANQKAQYIQDSLNGAYKLRLNYLEIPLLIHYTDKDFITVGTGFSWASLITANEWEHGKQTDTDAGNGVYKPYDVNVLIDLKMRIYRKLKFNFRYAYSMTKIRTRDFTTLGNTTPWRRHQYNNNLTFRLVYIFNEQQSEKALKEVVKP